MPEGGLQVLAQSLLQMCGIPKLSLIENQPHSIGEAFLREYRIAESRLRRCCIKYKVAIEGDDYWEENVSLTTDGGMIFIILYSIQYQTCKQHNQEKRAKKHKLVSTELLENLTQHLTITIWMKCLKTF